MQALAPEHVVYAGTASKSLAPGLRLGWLVVPAELMEALVQAKLLADVQTGVLDQLTLAELIRCGAYDRHIRRCRLVYQRRRERLVAALRRRVPEARVAGVAAGLQALVALPAGQTEADASPPPPSAAWRSRGSRASPSPRRTPRGPGRRLRQAPRARVHHRAGPALRRPRGLNVTRFTQQTRRGMNTRGPTPP